MKYLKQLAISVKISQFMQKKYFIQTFGCAQNEADSERIASFLIKQGYKKAKAIKNADYIVINTCMIREMAENRVYGLINNLRKFKIKNSKLKIVLTGCMVGMAVKDKTGKFLKALKRKLPEVDDFLPIEEIGFDLAPLRESRIHAQVPISNGCNNFCAYCVVPFTRGREVSRPFAEIIKECVAASQNGYREITLIGQNVNSYGADIIQKEKDINNIYYLNEKRIKPVLVKHLGRYRIPTLFPYLLEQAARLGFDKVNFISSNPWDFSAELINVIKKNPNVSRDIHLPVQSGSDSVLRRMNRWYTRKEYLELVRKLKSKIINLKLSTDIIVGFCGETEEEFSQTVSLVKKAGFYKAYIARYSDRPMTAAHKVLKDDVSHRVKKKRWKILEDLINKPNLPRKKI